MVATFLASPVTDSTYDNPCSLPARRLTMCPLSELLSFAHKMMQQLQACFKMQMTITKACVLSCCRYYVTQEWVAKKLDALVDVSEHLDLEWLRGRGPQADEQLQPEDAQPSAKPESATGLAC